MYNFQFLYYYFIYILYIRIIRAHCAEAIIKVCANINSDILLLLVVGNVLRISCGISFGTNRMVILVFSVDRDRLRERERQARAAMSVHAEQAAAGGGPDTRHHHHHHHNHVHNHNMHVTPPNLFRAPVRVSIFSVYSISAIDETVFFPHRYMFLHVSRMAILIIFFSANIRRAFTHSKKRRTRYSISLFLFLRYSRKIWSYSFLLLIFILILM